MSELYTLKNDRLEAVFSSIGAELISLKKNGKQFIFRDARFWDYSAPVLFPICGGLKDDKFILEGKEYTLAKHGFTRDAEFKLEKLTDTSATFLLTDSEETRKSYPFNFEFRVIYTISGDALSVIYSTTNMGKNVMYYSVGCHEAYLCPEGIENYTLFFDKKETLDSHIVRGNLLDYETVRIMEDSDKLPLKYDYFSVDALAFSKFESAGVTLSANDGSRTIKVDFPGFSHLLLWTKNTCDAPYICIEPWCGFPDMVDSEYDITKRPGIIKVAPGENHITTHTITFIK